MKRKEFIGKSLMAIVAMFLPKLNSPIAENVEYVGDSSKLMRGSMLMYDPANREYARITERYFYEQPYEIRIDYV